MVFCSVVGLLTQLDGQGIFFTNASGDFLLTPGAVEVRRASAIGPSMGISAAGVYQFANDRIDAGDIGAGHQVTAIYEVVPADGDGWISARRYEDKLDKKATDLAAEAAYVKLRYKLPDGDTSTLLTYTLPASALSTSRAPSGDFAFAASVAAFAQKLRGDTLLGQYSYPQIAALAGSQNDFWRQEYIQLVKTADSIK